MNRTTELLSIACLLVCSGLTCAHAAEASGQVTLEGVDFEVVDAMAYANRGGLTIALTNQAFDRDKMRADGKVDTFDRMRHDGQALMINLKDGAVSGCIDYAFDIGDSSTSGSICNSTIAETIVIDRHDAEQVVGRMDWTGDDNERVNVTFEAGIEPSGD